SMRDSFVARARHAAVAGIAIVAVFFLRATTEAQTPNAGTTKYPAAPKGGQIDDLGGIRVPNPYRWLESPSSPEVRAWVGAQNALTESFLSDIARRREIQDLTTREWNYTKVSAPFSAADRLFYFENSGLENQPVLYMQERTDPMARVLIDPNAF